MLEAEKIVSDFGSNKLAASRDKVVRVRYRHGLRCFAENDGREIKNLSDELLLKFFVIDNFPKYEVVGWI